MIRIGLIIFISLAGASVASSDEQRSLPSATNLVQRMIDRANQVAKGEKQEKYCYIKKSVTQELNSHGETINSTEKEYEVVLIRGWPFDRLVKVQGKQLSEVEIQKENQREQAFREKVAGRDMKQRRSKREAWLTAELLARFNFNAISNDVCCSRKAVVLEFKPKRKNPEDTLEDKILNRLAGRLWVDDQDAEIAKLDVHLTEELSLGWLGMIGSLKECNLLMQRQRMPDGVWVNAKHTLSIIGRKVLSSIKYRSTEESRDFRPAS